MNEYNRVWYLDKETKRELTRQIKYFISKNVRLIRDKEVIPADELLSLSRHELAIAFLQQNHHFVDKINNLAIKERITYDELLEDIEVKIDLLIPQQYHVAKVKLRSLISGEVFKELIKDNNYMGIETLPEMKFIFEENYKAEQSFFKYLERIKQ